MVLIRGAEIIDGTGAKARSGDLLIRGNRISAIGKFPRQKADVVVDASGSLLLPGFIDVNTSSDHYLALFSDPEQGSFLLDGVTTAIGGNCGSSLAPLLYGSLESIRKWTDTNKINVGWHSVFELLQALEAQGLGINFGTLAGHSTIRRAILGDQTRDLTDKEREIFAEILTKALEEGAFGLSTGLGYIHAHTTPFHEIRDLLQIVRGYNGVYSTHLRNEEEGLLASVDETLHIVQGTGVKTIISHLRPLIGFEREFSKAIQTIEAARLKHDIHFDGFPFDVSFLPIYTLLPRFVKTGNLEEMVSHLERPGLREQIMRELPKFKPDDIKIVEANNFPAFNGKTIGTIAANRNLSIRDALMELMTLTKLRATVLFKNVNEDLALQSLRSPGALVASNAPSAHNAPWFTHGRFHETFKKYVSFMRATNSENFEESIKKITSAPAQKFGLKGRGEVREGNFADLVLMKDDKVTDVFVNGVPVVRFGKLLNMRAGKVLRNT